MTSPHALAQLERACKTWSLVVHEDPSVSERLELVRRILRLKRFEAGALAARLPGVVRRGAQVDLQPLLERLTAAGIRAELLKNEEKGSTCGTR